MLGVGPLILGAAGFCLFTGLMVLYFKPTRCTNQIFFLSAALAAMWLFCVWKVGPGIQPNTAIQRADRAFWLQLSGATAGFLAWAIWLLYFSVTTENGSRLRIVRKSMPILAVAIFATPICFTDWYVTAAPFITKGIAYFLYAGVGCFVYGVLLIMSFRSMSRVKGLQRVEMQFLSLNLSTTFFGVLLLTIIGNAFHLRLVGVSSVIVFFIGYGIAAWAMMVHRIYNARQILLSIWQMLALLIIAFLGAVTVHRAFAALPSPTILLFFGTAAGVLLALWFDRKSRVWFRLSGDPMLAEIRDSISTIARTTCRPQQLVSGLEILLSDKCGTSFAAILVDEGPKFVGRDISLEKKRPAYLELGESGWATAESLCRRRNRRESEDLNDFLTDNSITAIVAAPRGAPSPSIIMIFGEKKDGWPFTFPEIENILSAGDTIDNILLHSRLAAELALKSRLEHLAMMSRGLAHDLKNLITPVDSFLVHTESRVTPGTPEAEVHAAAKRSVAVMTDYIREALFFGNRLNPRFERVSIRELLHSSVEVTATRAQRSRVHVSLTTDGMDLWRIDRVLVQRMLVNLLNNAIDACPGGGAVVMTSAVSGDGRLQIHVQDTGTGIAPEHLPRVFDPYFTTKQFGDDVRGFGLGLTICEKIARLHGGEISVASELGHGTIFTVELPPEPPIPEIEPETRAGTPERQLPLRPAPSALPS